MLNLYNPATALDPALVALTRASPFYKGRAPGLAARTAFYRGSALFGCERLYTDLPEVGDLRLYSGERRRADREPVSWLPRLARSYRPCGVEQRLFFETGGNGLKAFWNPVRLNQHGTVELRSIDGNYPEVILAIADLVDDAASRVRAEGLTVEPDSGPTASR